MDAKRETQEEQRPIVLLVGCEDPEALRNVLNIETEYVAKLAGARVLLQNCWTPDAWWARPMEDKNLAYLLFDFWRGKRTPAFIERWLSSPGFVKEVRKHIPANDPQMTKIVIIDHTLCPETSDYTRAVFADLFPNANYYVWRYSTRNLKSIWRTTEVTELKPKSPEYDMLDWPVSQLSSRLSGETMSQVQEVVPGGRVSGLVLLTREELHTAGHFTANVLDGVEETLREHTLKLGMTGLEIVAWFHAHNPPKASMAEMVGCAG